MNSPDGIDADVGPTGPRRVVLYSGLAIAAMSGLALLGTLTGPDPETTAASSSTTSTTIAVDPDNFSMDQIATGEPLEWEQVAVLGDMTPRHFARHGGAIILFASESPGDRSRHGDGLVAIRSEDGIEWDSIGTVLDGLAIDTIHSTPQGLVAIERQPRDQGLQIWRSTDAREWTSQQIPIEIESEHVKVYATATGGNDDVLVVAPRFRVDLMRLLEEHLGVELDLMTYGIGSGTPGAGPEIVVYGPLGFPAMELTASDLGLSESEREWLLEGISHEGGTEVWSLAEGSDWDVTVFEEAYWVDSFAATTDGTIVASGYGGAGASLWSSADGVQWQAVPPGTPVREITNWRDQLVGIAESSALEIMASPEGITWEATGLGEHFPESLDWHVDSLVADEGRMAVVVVGQRDLPGLPRPPAILRADNGAILNLDPTMEIYEVVAGEATHRYHPGGPGVDVDMANREVTFLDVETGDSLATFAFEQLREAETAYWSNVHDSGSLIAFAGSLDGSTWVIESASAAFGCDRTVLQLELTTERVIALLSSPTASAGAPGLEIWSAPIP